MSAKRSSPDYQQSKKATVGIWRMKRSKKILRKVMQCKSLFIHGESPIELKVKTSLMRLHVLRGLPLLVSELSEKWRFFACLIAFFA